MLIFRWRCDGVDDDDDDNDYIMILLLLYKFVLHAT